jgi:long-chain acyl-CoA synthetase
MDFNRNGQAHRPEAPDWQRVRLEDYPCDTRAQLPYPHASISVLLTEAVRRFPERPACTIFGKSVTYRQLDERARRMARSLTDLGARPGRFVGILLPNIPEYLVALQATWLTGATVLQLSPLMVAEEIAHWLKATGCHIVVTLDLLAGGLTGCLDDGPLEHVVVTSLIDRLATWKSWLYRIERYRRNGILRLREDAHQHRFPHLLAAPPLGEGPHVMPDEDIAVLAPTGGTTASPKAVMLTHRNLLANAIQLLDWSGGNYAPEGTLGVLPFFHAFGLSGVLLTAWAKAGTVHLHPRFEPKSVLSILTRHHVELFPAVPAMLNALNVVLRRHPYDLSFIRAVISGASAMPAATRAEFESYHPQQVLEGYGLTEASPVTHVNPLGAGRPGTIGLPLPDTDARIVDPHTGLEELPVGAVGELIVRGPQVMKGYYENPEETARVLRNGWLFTGDMASRDADGYYRIVDRKKDIIKTSGFLVFPAEVEEILRTFDTVAEAAVIGVPDAERGELVKALVVPHKGKAIDVAALESHCQKHLGKHKRPRIIEVVDELPKNFLGKVLRRKLREAPLEPSRDDAHV